MFVFQAGKACCVEMRYFTIAEQALRGYNALYMQQLNDGKMSAMHGTTHRNIGSQKFQQV